MLKVVRNPVFKAPVIVQLPADGGQREARFTGHFKALTRSQLQGYDLNTSDGMDAFLREVVTGWDELVEDDGSKFAFTAENLDLLLDLPHMRAGFQLAYLNATSGVKAARRGN